MKKRVVLLFFILLLILAACRLIEEVQLEEATVEEGVSEEGVVAEEEAEEETVANEVGAECTVDADCIGLGEDLECTSGYCTAFAGTAGGGSGGGGGGGSSGGDDGAVSDSGAETEVTEGGACTDSDASNEPSTEGTVTYTSTDPLYLNDGELMDSTVEQTEEGTYVYAFTDSCEQSSYGPVLRKYSCGTESYETTIYYCDSCDSPLHCENVNAVTQVDTYTETDDGEDYATAGSVIKSTVLSDAEGSEIFSGVVETLTDTCISSGRHQGELREYFIDGDYWNYVFVDCTDEYGSDSTCEESACVEAAEIISEAPYLGVYTTSVKKSAYSWDDNATATIDAVEGIGANFYGYGAYDGDTSDPTQGFYWPNFLEFLEETKDTDVEVLAVVQEKHILSGTSRWGVSSSSSYDAWVDAHIAAAEEFSALAVDYPQFMGFTIDDFGGYPCSATHEIRDADCYTVDDVAAITAAAKISDPDFMFLPTIYYPQFGESLVPGYILGSPYGVQMVNGEYAAMTVTFALDFIPTEANLGFLHYDTNTYDGSYVLPVYKEVWVNGQLLYNDSVNGDEYVEYFNDNIVPYLLEGENEIVLRLYSGGVNFYHDKMWYIWDLSVEGTDFLWSNNETTFAVDASMTTYTNDKGDIVENTGRIVAKTNEEYLIDVDGVVAPYSVDQTFYSLENYTVLLESTEDALGDKPQIVVLYATFWGKEFDIAVLREQTETAASLTDGVLLWSYPLDLYFPDEGVYSQRDSPDSSYELFAYFPGQQQGIEGWYQTWTSNEQLSGTVEITVKDNWDGTYTPDYFVKKILGLETGELYYNDSITGAEGAETVSIDLGTEPVTFVISVEETDGVGNAPAEVYFHVVDADGNTLDKDAWTFDSGTTYQNRRDVYEELADAFKDIVAVRFAAPKVENGFFVSVVEFLKRLFA